MPLMVDRTTLCLLPLAAFEQFSDASRPIAVGGNRTHAVGHGEPLTSDGRLALG